MSDERPSAKGRVCIFCRICILLLILVIIVLETAGFPRWASEYVTGRMSKGKFLVDAEGMRLDLLTGIYLRDVKVFRKKVIGPPAIECDGMRIRSNPSKWTSRENSSLSVEFIGGAIQPRQATGESSGGGGDISGLHVMLTDMNVAGIPFKRVSTEVSASGTSISATNIVCLLGGDYGRGRASGWVSVDGSDHSVNGRIITELDPHLIKPLLEHPKWAYVKTLIQRFVWNESKPLVDTQFKFVGAPKGRGFSSRSLFSMKDYTYRDIRNDTCDGLLEMDFNSTSGVVNVDHIMIGIDDGVIVGGFTFRKPEKTVSYRAVSDVDPRDFFQMVGLFSRESLKSFRFDGKTRFLSEGSIDVSGRGQTSLKAEVDSSGLGIGKIVSDRCFFNVSMDGPTCRLTDIQGSIWGGTFDARAEIVLSREDPDLVHFGCQLKDCDFPKVAEAFTSVSNDLSGKFYVEVGGDFQIATNSLETMVAAGRMSVDDGRVFQLPVFGGLTAILAKIIPGLDFVLRQGDMSADFDVANGKVSSEKVHIDGGVLSLKANGSTSFAGQHDYAIQLTLLSDHTVVAKLLRAVTWPISKLMEFRLKSGPEGTVWYPVNFSSELLEKIGLKKPKAESSPPPAKQ